MHAVWPGHVLTEPLTNCRACSQTRGTACKAASRSLVSMCHAREPSSCFLILLMPTCKLANSLNLSLIVSEVLDLLCQGHCFWPIGDARLPWCPGRTQRVWPGRYSANTFLPLTWKNENSLETLDLSLKTICICMPKIAQTSNVWFAKRESTPTQIIQCYQLDSIPFPLSYSSHTHVCKPSWIRKLW